MVQKQKSRRKSCFWSFIWSNNVANIARSTTTQTNTSCHKVVSSCKAVFRTLAACEANAGFNPLVPWMPCQSMIRWHVCLATRQLPDASHVSLLQQVWWCFRWQVDSLGGVSAALFKVVSQPWWHSKLMLLSPNLNTSWSAHLGIKRLIQEEKRI